MYKYKASEIEMRFPQPLRRCPTGEVLFEADAGQKGIKLLTWKDF